MVTARYSTWDSTLRLLRRFLESVTTIQWTNQTRSWRLWNEPDGIALASSTLFGWLAVHDGCLLQLLYWI